MSFTNIKKNHNYLISPFIFFCLLLGYVLYNTIINKKNDVNITDFVVTIVILIVMFAILLIDAIIARKKLNSITKALEDTTQKLKNNEDVLESIKSCEDEFLKKCLLDYCTDKKRANENGKSVCPDISEYINEQIIADKTYREITNQVSNTMTGLGLLGTFVGLTLGLNNFNQSDIGSSTNQLIEGIKTAFYTSIFGVVASIIYNYFYYCDIEKNNIRLEEFYGVFNDKVASDSNITFYNEVLNHNKTLYDEMLNHNKNEADLIAKAITPVLADAINKSVVPVMEKLNTSIDDYIMRAVEAQSSTLQKIVDTFMVKLNTAMDYQFHALSESINKMCTWQNESVDKLKVIVTQIEEVSNGLSKLNVDMNETEKIRNEINNDIRSLISETKCYVDEFKIYTNQLNLWTNELKNETEKNAECSNTIKENMDTINKEINSITMNFENVITELKEYREETEKTLETHKNDNIYLIDSVDSITKKFDFYVAENNKGLNQNMSLLERAINNLISCNDDLNKNIEFIIGQFAIMEQSMKNESTESTNFISATNDVIKRMQSSWDKYNEKLNKNYADIIMELRKLYQSQESSLTKTVENISEELNIINDISFKVEESIKHGMQYIADSNNKLLTEKLLPILNNITNDKKTLSNVLDRAKQQSSISKDKKETNS